MNKTRSRGTSYEGATQVRREMVVSREVEEDSLIDHTLWGQWKKWRSPGNFYPEQVADGWCLLLREED